MWNFLRILFTKNYYNQFILRRVIQNIRGRRFLRHNVSYNVWLKAAENGSTEVSAQSIYSVIRPIVCFYACCWICEIKRKWKQTAKSVSASVHTPLLTTAAASSPAEPGRLYLSIFRTNAYIAKQAPTMCWLAAAWRCTRYTSTEHSRPIVPAYIDFESTAFIHTRMHIWAFQCSRPQHICTCSKQDSVSPITIAHIPRHVPSTRHCNCSVVAIAQYAVHVGLYTHASNILTTAILIWFVWPSTSA